MNFTKETLALAKAALTGQSELAKAYTQSLGLTAYDLQAPALSLVPVLTPMRNKAPRVKGAGDTATRWRAVTGINTANTRPQVSEGNRGAVVTTAVTNYTAPYSGIGLEDYVTFEADYAAEGFEDVKASAALRLLWATMIAEEEVIYGGNFSLALGTTPTPTLSASASGGSMATQAAASVICVALTHEGWRYNTVASGLTASISKSNIDGSSDTIPGGVAQKSANATVSVTGPTGSINASVAPVNGAVAYAWYVGATAGNERLAAITTINSVVLTSFPGASQLASALPAADNSANTMGMDGFLTFAFKSGGAIGVQATGTVGTGTPLTADTANGIVEITTDLRTLYDAYRLGPNTIWASSQEIQNITKKVVGNGGSPLFRLTQAANGAHNATGGVVVTGVLNPFTGEMIDLVLHPNAAPGTLLYTTDKIPYPLNGIANVYQIKCRRDYYQLEWPVVKRRYEYGVYADEVLQHYAPFSLAVRSNIANG